MINSVINTNLKFHHQSEVYKIYYSSCTNCKHFNMDTFSCPAFKVVPDVILSGDNKHLNILPNQRGTTVFEPK